MISGYPPLEPPEEDVIMQKKKTPIAEPVKGPMFSLITSKIHSDDEVRVEEFDSVAGLEAALDRIHQEYMIDWYEDADDAFANMKDRIVIVQGAVMSLDMLSLRPSTIEVKV